MTVPLPICVQQSLGVVAPGGTILFFTSTKPGVKSEFDLWDLWQNEVTITHSYSADYHDLYTALKWIENKKINVKDMITHHFPLAQTSDGFMLASNPTKGSLKIIIHPNQ
jgi:L-iditol 2-dehydrogenase